MARTHAGPGVPSCHCRMPRRWPTCTVAPTHFQCKPPSQLTKPSRDTWRSSRRYGDRSVSAGEAAPQPASPTGDGSCHAWPPCRTAPAPAGSDRRVGEAGAPHVLDPVLHFALGLGTVGPTRFEVQHPFGSGFSSSRPNVTTVRWGTPPKYSKALTWHCMKAAYPPCARSTCRPGSGASRTPRCGVASRPRRCTASPSTAPQAPSQTASSPRVASAVAAAISIE